MLDIFESTCTHAGKSLRWSPKAIFRYLLVLGGVVLLYLFLEGKDRMAIEIKDILVYGSAFVILAVVPTFLWNLFLAPSRLVEERLDKKINAIMNRTGPDSINPVEEPQEIDVSSYQKHKVLALYQAACLWYRIDPHCPIRDPNAKVMLSQLKSSIIVGDLPCRWGGLPRVLESLTGTEPKMPGDKQQVSMTALRRYADKIGDVPLFLLHIQLPPKSVNGEGDSRRLTPPTSDKSDA